MLRGLLLGASWGGLIAVTAVTAVSLSFSDVNQAQVTGETPATTPATTPETSPEMGSTTATQLATAPAVGTSQDPVEGAAMPQTDDASTTLPATDTVDVNTDVPAVPAATAITDSDATPANSETANAQTPKAMTQAGEDAQTAWVTNPETDDAAQPIGTADTPVPPADSAAMPKPPQPETQPNAELQTEAMTAPAMQAAPDAGDASQDAAQDDAPVEAPEVKVAALPQIRTPDQPKTPQTDAAMAQPTPADPPVSQTPDDAAPNPAEPAESTKSDEPAAEPAKDDQFEAPRATVPKITNLAPNVKTNRLPTIGGAAETKVAETQGDETQTVEVGQEVSPDADKGALATYAMAFDNTDARPMFSVVLIDDPEHPIADDVLAHLPFAVSFAIDAVRDDAHAVSTRYRKAGFEVLMLTNLPFGANATDVEVAFGAYSRAIPEAIGVLDLGGNGFLRGPNTATQIAGIMSEKGFGLVTPSKGLNSAQKAALREGVPAVLVYRELDAEGEKSAVIRRYLDRAAFRAAQEGSVIMLGRSRADTIEALVTWALQDRAASVAIAPVSVVLLGQ